ncbi:uncharacterized protein LOC123708773 [Pieris brassicae]|uniref:uncharacterized protein LOC123708773 n=1 Tax=Pieris brassicae TaxID=7116 RepID=UPI001E65FF8D|nr:uncharacterized protein LOC123708773 [Pieris brassicae]
MVVFIVIFALFASPIETLAQTHASIYVDVAPEVENLEVEKRYTPELLDELQSAKADALLLYTEYTAQASTDMKTFIRNISRLTEDTVRGMNKTLLDSAPSTCRTEFEKHLKKIEYDAHRAATFSAENHHKFFLGHMIVFRMHLNKSEEYIRKCDTIIKTCGTACETTSRMIRWRRLALSEINRVRDDIQHSRQSYKDLLLHVHRKLNHFRRRANSRSKEAIASLEACTRHRL